MPEAAFDKLDVFTSAITADALEEANRIYKEIQLEREHALSSAENSALSEMFGYIKSEVSKIRGNAGRRVSEKMMDNKRRLNLRRKEMTDDVLREVTDKISKYTSGPSYTRQLTTILFRVMDIFQEDAVIYLREEDMHLEPLLRLINTPYNLEFKTGNFSLGGLMASCPLKKLEIDESFDTTLVDLKDSFAEMFGLELAD